MSISRAPHEQGRAIWSTLLFAGILGVVLWSPVPFGSVEPWAIGLLRIAACALLVVWAVGGAANGAFVVNSSPLQIPLYLAAAYAFIQSAPIGGQTISVDPYASWQSAVTLLAFAVLFSMALVALEGRRRLVLAAQAIFWAGFCLSVLGILQHLSGTREIYWLRESPIETFFGPFVNKNHFAGLMELAMPAGLGLVLTGAIPRERRPLMLFAAAIIAVAVALSRSRAGLLCLGVEILVLIWAAVAGAKVRAQGLARTVALGAALVAAVGVGIVWLGADPIAQSFTALPEQAALQDATSRQGVWRATVSLAAAHPIFGAGIGAYGTAILGHWPSTEYATLLQAHNDYLQVVADGGVIGAILAILFAVALGGASVRGLRASDPAIRGVALGAGAGLLGLGIHSIVDFNLQIPSNALTFLFMSALVARAASFAAPRRTEVV